MKTLAAFAIMWTTATLLLLWLVDYNMYVRFANGSAMLKEQASFSQRLAYSASFAFLYSLINIGLLWCLQKLIERWHNQAQK